MEHLQRPKVSSEQVKSLFSQGTSLEISTKPDQPTNQPTNQLAKCLKSEQMRIRVISSISVEENRMEMEMVKACGLCDAEG